MDIDNVLKEHGLGTKRSNIKSIQRGTIAVDTFKKNVPISTIDLSRSIVLITYKMQSSNIGMEFVMAQLTASTNFELSVSVLPKYISDQTTVYWTVVEFNNVKSLQNGTVTCR